GYAQQAQQFLVHALSPDGKREGRRHHGVASQSRNVVRATAAGLTSLKSCPTQEQEIWLQRPSMVISTHLVNLTLKNQGNLNLNSNFPF
ncbi:hypothetical protein NK983_29855, partial [Salmonella enterica subsp. enterica serovar Typhimurium]|nr:hypothetical protein [Salmonella enterica subsp. enterica serovar Typhimurium]